jgi:hypothetical protein
MDEVFSSQPEMTNRPISHPDGEYFMNGRSFVWYGTHVSGFEESKYAFTTIHVPGALYKERGLINSGEKKSIKHGQKNSEITRSFMVP